MTKYWALIVASRPHIFNIGEHENVEQAEGFATAWCDQKNAAREEMIKEFQAKNPDKEVPNFMTYDLAYIMDDEDMRQLTGEVHRPRRIVRKKREVAVETPVTHGNENCQCDNGEFHTPGGRIGLADVIAAADSINKRSINLSS